MRIILELKAVKKYNPDFNYHYKAQGFIYSMLINTKYRELHNKEKYKFFCFSNIFKGKNDQNWRFIVSSPDEKLIDQIGVGLKSILNYKVDVLLGGGTFKLKSYKIFKPFDSFNVITGSPITISIGREKFEKATGEKSEFDTVFWQPKHSIKLFVDAIENNLKEKFKEFTKSEITSRILEKYELKKKVSTRLMLPNGNNIPILGTIWEFQLSSKLTEKQANFCVECGFGERNPIGFGFMNRK